MIGIYVLQDSVHALHTALQQVDCSLPVCVGFPAIATVGYSAARQRPQQCTCKQHAFNQTRRPRQGKLSDHSMSHNSGDVRHGSQAPVSCTADLLLQIALLLQTTKTPYHTVHHTCRILVPTPHHKTIRTNKNSAYKICRIVCIAGCGRCLQVVLVS
jgi:hypothetical protein